jgi:hypothetical protein
VKHSYKLGEVWESMKSSDDFLLQVAGYHSEMVNTIGIVSFLWLATFMLIIPTIASIVFPKRRNLVFIVAFIVSFSVMGLIQSWAWEKVNIHWDMMNKPYIINVDDTKRKDPLKATIGKEEKPYIIKVKEQAVDINSTHFARSYAGSQLVRILNKKNKDIFSKTTTILNVEESRQYTSSTNLLMFEIKYVEPIFDNKTNNPNYIEKSKYFLVKLLPTFLSNFNPLELNTKDFIFYEILNYDEMKYISKKSFMDRDVCITDFFKDTSRENSWISNIQYKGGTSKEWRKTDKCFFGNLDYELKEVK